MVGRKLPEIVNLDRTEAKAAHGALRVIDPALPIIAMSGLTERVEEQDLVTPGVPDVLTKPCDGPTLLETVHRRLAATPQRTRAHGTPIMGEGSASAGEPNLTRTAASQGSI